MKVPNTHESAGKCICSVCPTYPAGDKGLFCGFGKSEKNVAQKGCVCDDCRNFSEYGLTEGYFCSSASAECGCK